MPFATVPDGPPHHFTWRRATHVVARVEGPERIAMEWWKQDGEALTRDYFRVEDEEGRRFWIFRDGLYGSELADEEGEPVPPTGSCTGCSHEHADYAEIGITTNFSFLRGGSDPRAYVHEASRPAEFPSSASPITTRWPAWCAPGRSSITPTSRTSQSS